MLTKTFDVIAYNADLCQPIFYRASAQHAMQSPVLAIVELSICLSAWRLSHAGTVSKPSPMNSPRTLVSSDVGFRRDGRRYTALESNRATKKCVADALFLSGS